METQGYINIIRLAYERQKMNSAYWNYRMSHDRSLSKRWREYFEAASWLSLFELAEFWTKDV